MITKNEAAKFWADYFGATEQEALACHHLTIDCMVKFAEQVKNRSIPDIVERSEQLPRCQHNRETFVTAIAETYLRVDVNCPHCDASLDIRNRIGEAWLPNRLDIPKCEIEIVCDECKGVLLVTRVDY